MRERALCMNDMNCLARGRMAGSSIFGLDFEDLAGFLATAAEGARNGMKGWR